MHVTTDFSPRLKNQILQPETKFLYILAMVFLLLQAPPNDSYLFCFVNKGDSFFHVNNYMYVTSDFSPCHKD